MRWVIFIVSGVIGLSVDLGSKSWAFGLENLNHPGARLPVVADWFDIALARNPGGAFGLLTEWPAVFHVVSFLALVVGVVALITFVHRSPARARLQPALLGLVLAGAIGNFHDRWASGWVRDFIDWHTPPAGAVHDAVARIFGQTHWPAFNAADAFIDIGAAAVFLLWWGEERRRRATSPVREPSAGASEGA
jgi:signal peptidase II